MKILLWSPGQNI